MGQEVFDDERPASGLWLLMSNIAARCGRESLRGLDGCKLGVQGARVLVYLLEQEGLRCSALANAVGLEATALSHLLRSLTDQGLIARARATSDQRTIEVSLTARGRDVAEQCRALSVQTESLLSTGFETADLRDLRAILTRMSANLDAAGRAEV